LTTGWVMPPTDNWVDDALTDNLADELTTGWMIYRSRKHQI
jgi:hypothetical protein